MKKYISVTLAVMLFITITTSCFMIPVIKNRKEPLPLASYEEVKKYCDQIKEMSFEKNAVDSRLIVMANKKIDFRDAVQSAECSDGSYVLQYKNRKQAEEALEYYNSKSYVLAACFDCLTDIQLSSTDPGNFSSNTYSVTNSNIDDAYKLLDENNIDLPEIRVGIVDTGVAVNDITSNRLLDGYSYLNGYNINGTQIPATSKGYHGTSTAGTVIRNTLDNVKICSYQFTNGEDGDSGLSIIASAFQLAAAQGCNIINLSAHIPYDINDPISEMNYNSHLLLMNLIIKQIKNLGCHIVCSAGNDNKELNDLYYLPQKCDNILVAGANDLKNIKASYSNYGSLVDIYTLGNNVSTCNVNGSLTENFSGTSASSPILASLCTILLAVNPDITDDEIVSLLRNTGYGFNEEKGTAAYTIADAYEAVKNLLASNGLNKAQFTYKITKDETTNNAILTINAPDDTKICYRKNSASTIYLKPYVEQYNKPLRFSSGGLVSVCAYSPGKEKNYKLIRIPNFNSSEYSVIKADKSSSGLNTLSNYNTSEKCVEVPEYADGVQIQEIGEYCFMGNKNIEKVVLPESVTKIGAFAFSNCPNLKTVIASGVTECGRYCFSNCNKLTRLSLPKLQDGNTSILENCESLKLLESGCMSFNYNRSYYNCRSLKMIFADYLHDMDIEINKNAVLGTALTLLTDNPVTNADNAGVTVIKTLDGHTCEYMCEDNYDSTYSYYCLWCWKEQKYSASDLLTLWNPTYINKAPSSYGNGYLLDVNCDNIINIKDFAMINKNV